MERDIDKLFKKGLEGYASGVPDHVWSGLSLAVAQNDRQRRYLWLWIILLFVALLSVGAFYFLPGADQNPPVDPEAKPDERAHLPWQHEEDGRSKEDNVKEETVFSLPENPLRQALEEDSGWQVLQPANREQKVRFVRLPGITGQDDFASKVPPTLQVDKGPIGSDTREMTGILSYKRLDHPFSRLSASPQDFTRRQKTPGDCFEGPESRYMVGFNASIDYPFRTMHSLGNGELASYLDSRRSTEDGMPSFNAGFTAGYFHSSGAIIKSGIQYTQINERFLHVKENIIRIQTHITIDTMYNQDGSYTIRRDTSIVEVLGREELRTFNQFRMLDVPLILGYTFDLARFSLDVNAGIIFNVTSANSGRIFNQDLIPSYYGSKGSGQFKPYTNYYGLSLYAGVSLLSRLRGHTQFYIEPHFRYYIKSFSNSQYPIRQKYFVTGLSTGIRYYF